MMDKATTHFGEHVTIDGYGGDREKLDSREKVFTVLNELPEKLGMTKMCEPQIYRAEPNGKKDGGGWTGIVVIAESHISVHTFPSKGFVTADVYTCKNGMDVDFILDYFKETFGLKEIEHNFIIRGTKYDLY
jgi:S-adenosylmethionine decarboxylase